MPAIQHLLATMVPHACNHVASVRVEWICKALLPFASSLWQCRHRCQLLSAVSHSCEASLRREWAKLLILQNSKTLQGLEGMCGPFRTQPLLPSKTGTIDWMSLLQRYSNVLPCQSRSPEDQDHPRMPLLKHSDKYRGYRIILAAGRHLWLVHRSNLRFCST